MPPSSPCFSFIHLFVSLLTRIVDSSIEINIREKICFKLEILEPNVFDIPLHSIFSIEKVHSCLSFVSFRETLGRNVMRREFGIPASCFQIFYQLTLRFLL